MNKKVDSDNLSNHLTKQQLIELSACVNCGECLKWCPVQDVTDDPSTSPPERIRIFKEFVEEQQGLKATVFGAGEISEERLKDFRKKLWKCILCGSCGEVCEVGIDTKKLWWSLRRSICESKVGMPDPVKGGPANYQKTRSPFPIPLSYRYKIWMPDDVEIAEQADICLYEGCGGAWDNPQSAEGAIRLLAAGGSVTVLDAEDAWCCGFPMVTGSGDWSWMPELVNHFVNAVKKKGVKKLAMICPMCRDIMNYVYPEYYGDKLPFEIVMVAEIIADYIDEGRIKFTKRLEETVTNHDPCALARPLVGPPILTPPRKILQALPGVKVVEMERHGELTRCCGGSSGQRPISPEMVVKMSKELMYEAQRSGADTIVTSCVACFVTLVGRTHFAPHPDVDEYKHFEEPVKINDLLQYAAALL